MNRTNLTIQKQAFRLLAAGTGVFLLGVFLPQSGAAEKGGERLVGLHKPIVHMEQVESMKTGDLLAMACSKCKTLWVTRVQKDAKGAVLLARQGEAPTQLIGTHACAGCGSKIGVEGHGKGKQASLKHTCEKCGEHSAFCCALVPVDASTSDK